MRRLRRLAAVCGLLASLTAASPPPPVATSEKDRTVTLVTGDRVVERRVPGGRGTHLPQAGNGRGHIRFVQYEVPGHHYVIPSDAARLIASGKLDEQLFDVPQLLTQAV